MTIPALVEAFLKTFCPLPTPVLLALSGGADSLCLFYCLLSYRQRYQLPFHIAHVDHGWRSESALEAQALQQLAFHYQIPFHLKALDPTLLEGNLEAKCRDERYQFFAAICQQYALQGVLTGHHQDDQTETVFKRLLEGAHWSRWGGLKPESWMQGVRILRPLLNVSKHDIQAEVRRQGGQAFEDPTNCDLHFLRARLRQTIFPHLNQQFGKQVQKNVLAIGKEAQELSAYFEARLLPFLDRLKQGPWGAYLDLQAHFPEHLVEIKYLVRLLCAKLNFFLSRELVEQIAKALLSAKSPLCLAMGKRTIGIDRRRVFIFDASSLAHPQHYLLLTATGDYEMGNWKVKVKEMDYTPLLRMTSWKEGWQGKMEIYLPISHYQLGFLSHLKQQNLSLRATKKRWSQAKVPLFLAPYIPLIWETTGGNIYELMTGTPPSLLKKGMPCWKIELIYTVTSK